MFAVPIVRNHLPVVSGSRHPDLCHATIGVLTSQPPEHAKIGMRVETLSDRRHKNNLRVNTASGANWLMVNGLSSSAFISSVKPHLVLMVIMQPFRKMQTN